MKYKIISLLFIFVTCFCFVFANENLYINSKTAVSVDADSSVVLYSKDMNKQIYPASTTKILTAILAIENVDLNKSVVVSKAAISIPWDSSSVYLQEGEVITIRDLLYCLLLNSGNDAANVLAEAVSGNIQSFVELMNEKVRELGCTNTHFNNAHGYSDDNHYTTALDMAKIFTYCIKNPTFANIIATKSYIVDKTNKTDEKRYLSNTNRLILQKEDSVYARYYEFCLGGKTGYTDEAGRTLVTYAKKDNKTVVVTVFGASASGKEDIRYTDAINLFEYSFNNFSKEVIANKDNYKFNYINVERNLNYSLELTDDLEILSSIHTLNNTELEYTLNIDENILKNMDIDSFSITPVGTITFLLNTEDGNHYEITKNLNLTNIQKYNTAFEINYNILLITVTVVILIFIIIFVKNKPKKAATITLSRKNRRK